MDLFPNSECSIMLYISLHTYILQSTTLADIVKGDSDHYAWLVNWDSTPPDCSSGYPFTNLLFTVMFSVLKLCSGHLCSLKIHMLKSYSTRWWWQKLGCWGWLWNSYKWDQFCEPSTTKDTGRRHHLVLRKASPHWIQICQHWYFFSP